MKSYSVQPMMRTRMVVNKDYIAVAIIMLLLPPIWSMLFYFLSNRKVTRIPVAYFFMSFSLFLVYLAPVYDVASTISQVYNYYPSIEYLISMKTSVVALYYTTSFLGCQSLNIYFLFYFITLYCIYKSYVRIVGTERYAVLFSVCSMALVSLISLTFSTMAAAVCCLMVSKKPMTLFKIALMLILCALIHKGLLLVILPALPIVWLMNKGKSNTVIILLFIFCLLALLAIDNLQGVMSFLMGVDDSGYLSFKANEYAGNGVWGSGYDLDDSMSKRLSMFLQYLFFGVTFLISLQNHKVIGNEWLLSLFWANIALLTVTLQLYVLSERFSISGMFFSSLIIAEVFVKRKKWKYLKETAIALSLMFLLSVYHVSAPVYRSPIVGSKGYDNNITHKTFYMPSVLLLDISDNGFTDKFIANKTSF